VELNGLEVTVRQPSVSGDVHFLQLPNPPVEADGDVFIVLVKRTGTVRSLMRMARSIPLRVQEGEAEVVSDGA
jgi:hypothetical protein